MQTKQLEKAMKEIGYYSFRNVQEVAIEQFEKNTSFALQAKTGSGKTLAFLFPTLNKIDTDIPFTQVLILSPTRELALQTSKKAKELTTYTSIHVINCIGGIPIQKQINALKTHAEVVIGTPGRLLDLLKQGYLKLDHITRVILDEADQILLTGEEEETRQILEKCHAPIALFSATVSEKVKAFLPADSKIIRVDDAKINENILTYFYKTEDAKEALFQYLKTEDIRSCIIFVNHKSSAQILTKALKKRNILCSAFSSDFNERKRLSVLRAFQKGEIRVIVATDAMARGMDIEDVSHIVHYELPRDTETLIHRSGRTAHNTENGEVIVFLSPKDYETEVGKYCIQNFKEYTRKNKKISTLTKTISKREEKKPQVTELLIRAGRKDKIRIKDIVGALCEKYPFEKIGAIEIQDNYSTVTIQEKDVKLDTLTIKGKKRKVEIKKE